MKEVILNWLSTLSLIHWIIGIIIIIGWFVRYYFKYIRLEFRSANNLRRHIYFLKTSNLKNLQKERDLLQKLKAFKIENDIKDISNEIGMLDTLKSNSVYIIWYDENYKNYDKLIENARNKKIPVIIFAKQWEIKNREHWELFNSYIYCDVWNTPNRLAIILLNMIKIV